MTTVYKIGRAEASLPSRTNCTNFVYNWASPASPAKRSDFDSSALSSLRKVFITESARNKLSSSHHALNSLLFALDGYLTATEDPAEIEETARTGTVGGGTGSGRERRDWVPLTGDPLFPSGRLYFFTIYHLYLWLCICCSLCILFLP